MNHIALPRAFPARLAAFVAALGFAFGALAQPANDNFASATQIFGQWGISTESTVGATAEAGEPAHANNPAGASVWYTWVAEQSGPITFDTFGSDFDTVLAVYTGSQVNNLNLIAANDFIYPRGGYFDPSVVTFNAIAGQRYYIAVDGYLGSMGNASLAWAYQPSGVFRFAGVAIDPFIGDYYAVSETDGDTTGDVSTRRSVTGVRITVTRMGGAVGRASVDVTTEDITAIGGLDYLPINATLTFDNLEMSKSFTLPLASNPCSLDDLKMFSIALSNPALDPWENPLTVSAPRVDPQHSLATVIMVDWFSDVSGLATNDSLCLEPYAMDGPSGAPPTVNFERSTYRVLENEGAAVLRVYRIGGGEACEIHYSCISSPPISENLRNNGFLLSAGSDYASPNPSTSLPPSPEPPDFQQVAGTLSWGQGDYGFREIVIPINNDDTPEFNEDFVVNLFRVPGHNQDAVVGRVGVARVTIIYDDYPAGALDTTYNTDNALISEPPYNSHPGANAPVNALVIQADDKAVIGGTFSSFNGIFRPRIARLLTNGQLDEAFDVGTGFANALDETPASVNSLVLDGAGRILAGGLFNSYNGTSRNGIARINSNGSLDISFNPGLGTTNAVWAVAVQPDGRIIVAGEFVTFNNEPRLRVARLNADGSVDPTFDTRTNGPNGTVYSMALSPTGEIYIGGSFTTVSGQARRGVARLTATGVLDPSFDPGAGFNDTVYAMALQSDGRLLVGGAFTVVDTFVLSRLARLLGNGDVDQSFEIGIGANATVFSITPIADGRFYIGGLFTSFNGTRRLGFARLFSSGYVDTSYLDSAYNQYAGLPTLIANQDVEPTPFVLASGVQSDGLVVIGGNFPFVGGGRIVSDYFGRLVTQSNWVESEGLVRSAIAPRQNVARLLNTPTVGPGNIGFTRDNYSANENGAFTFLTLARNNGSLGIMGSNFHIPERAPGVGVAQNGTDYLFSNPGPFFYTAYSTMRMWSDGIIGTNNNTSDSLGYGFYNYAVDDVIITLINNTVEEPNRNAPLVLSVPTQMDIFWLSGENIPLGTALGRSSAQLTIVDDDRRPGTITFAAPEYFVSEGVGTALISVIRTNGSSGVVSVNYTTTNQFLPPPTATPNEDFIPRSGVLTFRDGQTSTNISITILNNSLVEPDETVNLRLFNPAGGASIGNSNAVLWIIDDDFAPGRVNYSSGLYATNEAAGAARITVNRTGGSAGAVWLDAIVGPGSNSVAGVDFVAATNRLTWNDGDTAPKSFDVQLIDNAFVEPDKQILLTFADPSTNGLVGNIYSNAVLMVINDDYFGQVQFTTTNYFAKENGGPVLITVVRVNGGAQTVTVNFNTSPISAVPGINYQPVQGTLVFGPGVLTQAFEVPIFDNLFADGNVTLALTLSAATPTGALGSPSTAILTLVDDETFNEPAGSVDTSFDTHVGANGQVFALALQQDGKVVIGGDFTSFDYVTRTRLARLHAVNGSLDQNFLAAGTGPNGTVRAMIAQTDDRLVIGGAFTTVNGVVRNRICRLTGDGSVDTSFNPGGGADGPVLALAETFIAGQRKIVLGGAFTVVNSLPRNGVARLNNDGSLDTSFNIGTGVNGTVFAVATYPTNSIFAGQTLIGGDFTEVNGVARGRLARLNGDGSVDAFFDTTLGANDVVRAITIQPDGRILVGGSFTNYAGVTMNHFARLNSDGSLDPTFTPGAGANGTVYSITLQADQRILLGGEFTRCSGVSRSRVTRLMPDGTVDPQINFGTGANNLVAAIAMQRSVEAGPRIIVAGAFTEFDGIPRGGVARLYGGTLSGMGAFSFSEPDYAATEASTNATVTIRRLGGTSGPAPDGSVSVRFSTADGTALAGVNYIGLTNTVVFPLGETMMTVNVGLIDDFEVNADRTFEVLLSDPQPPGGPIIGGQPFATVTIINDDSGLSFSSPIYSRAENAVDGAATITIVRTGDVSGVATVEFATTTDGTAVAGVNYIPVTNVVTFLPGENSRNVRINLINNTLVEGDRTVTMELREPVGAILFSPFEAVLTIIDDDRAPGRLAFSTNNFYVSEAGGSAAINITRTNGWTGIVSVNFRTAPGTAAPIGDYQEVNTNVVFADGETNKTVFVPVFDNSVADGDRTVLLTLSNPSGGATLGVPVNATLTILDDEISVAFASPVFVVNEDGGNATLSVRRLGGTNSVSTVRYSTTNGTATAGLDYSPTSGTLNFNPGETLKTVNIPVIDDNLIEGDENFFVGLYNPSTGVQVGNPGFATVVILDNDAGFFFTNTVIQVLENATNAVITVVRTNPLTGTVSVNYATEDGSAIAGADYQAVTGTLVFTNGESVKSFLVPIVDDQLAEGDEFFTVSLSSPSPGSSLLDPSVQTVIIVDNDSGIRFSSPTYSVLEDGARAVITVLRTNFLASTVSVDYATEDGTATAGLDYVATSGTLVFTNGETSKTLEVLIIDDTLIEGDETVLLSLSNASADAALVSPSAAVLTIIDQDGSDIKPAGVSLVSESRLPANGVIDTNETVTLWFALRNAVGANTTNLTARLLATNGVSNPSAQQNYGVLTPGGPSASRQFTFTAIGTNGRPVFATFELSDNALPLGQVVFNFTLGTTTATFSNTAPITIRDNTTANPYPSVITVSGVGGSVSQASVSLSNVTHGFSGDIDSMLSSPAGQSVIFFSDAGRVRLDNVSFTFSDTATATVPTNGPISSGTYRPFNEQPDFFPAPAPSGPYATNLSAFNGSNPNGLWNLFIVDDSAGDWGDINGGWYLHLITANPVVPSSDLAVAMTAAPSPVIVLSNLTYTISVTNFGPAGSTNTVLTNLLPAGAVFLSATTGTGTAATNAAGALVWNIGTLAKDARASLTVVMRPTVVGNLTNRVTVSGLTQDLNSGNNIAAVITPVNAATADLAIGMDDSPDPAYVGGTVLFSIVVTNFGPATATGVQVTNLLPIGYQFLPSSTVSQGTISAAGQTVIANLGTLGAGSTASVMLRTRAVIPGTYTNTAGVGALDFDPLKGNNTVAVKSVVEEIILTTAVVGNSLVITYPNVPGFALQSASSLRPPVVWLPVNTAGAPVVNGHKVVTLPMAGAGGFYRVVAP